MRDRNSKQLQDAVHIVLVHDHVLFRRGIQCHRHKTRQHRNSCLVVDRLRWSLAHHHRGSCRAIICRCPGRKFARVFGTYKDERILQDEPANYRLHRPESDLSVRDGICFTYFEAAPGQNKRDYKYPSTAL